MITNFNIVRTISAVVVLLVLLLPTFQQETQAQCDSIVPSFTVDLSTNPQGVWTSPNVKRDGNCCGTTNPDRCIEFVVTLHPNAVGIYLDLISGAIPSGSMYYQVGCASPVAVGSILCLYGPGPHTITFCKPGANKNEYQITSVLGPYGGDDVYMRKDCPGQLSSTGYDQTSINWTSVSPGAPGDYDHLLSCTSCDSPYVNFAPGMPSHVQYVVSGVPYSVCPIQYYYDTIDVYIADSLIVDVPDTTYLCTGLHTTTLTPVVSGGFSPYNYFWDNGQTTQSIVVDTGYFNVKVQDTLSSCPGAQDTGIVLYHPIYMAIDGGPDLSLCEDVLPVSLQGSFTGVLGAYWTGSGGTITFNPDSVNIIYTPSAAELASGSSSLIFTSVGNHGCPPLEDTVNISYIPVPNVDAGANDTICLADSIQLEATGAMKYVWSPASTLSDPYIANPWADPSVTTTYYVIGFDTTDQMLVNGNFNSGNTGFGSPLNYNNNLTVDGGYYVGTDPSLQNSAWTSCGDHTSGTGNMLMANTNDAGEIVWEQTVSVVPNTDYMLTYWVLNNNPTDPAAVQSMVDGSIIGPVTNISYNASCQWTAVTELWNSGTDTLINLQISTAAIAGRGNEISIDDIYFGASCFAQDSVTIAVTPEKVSAGPDGIICEGDDFYLIMAFASNYSQITWTTSGTGTFNDPNSMNPIYTPSPADIINGYVDLTINVVGLHNCSQIISDTMTLTINPKPITSLIYHF